MSSLEESANTAMPPSERSSQSAEAHAPLRARPGDADTLSRRVEILRLLAIFLLVSYHVVGSGPTAGLRLDYPHGLRIMADALVEIRMPLFAFVAGFVYAIRPVTKETFGRFMSGKVQRLLVPGAIAATLFFGMSIFMDTRLEREAENIWRIYVFPYAHFWFLQSIFLIFTAFAVIDIITGHRAAVPFALAVTALYLSGIIPNPNIFSMKGAVYLAPYFAFGVIWKRYAEKLYAQEGRLLAIGLLGLAVAIAWTLVLMDDSGHVSGGKRDVQSLLFGASICVVLMAQPLTPRRIYALGSLSFTIYLYHVFGTSGMRRILSAMSIESVPIHFVLGTLAGILGPIVLHLALARWRPTRRFVLGIR